MPARVWDSFLTEQDRAHLALSRHRDIGFGQRPALLLIDLYRWVFGDQPEPLLESVKKWPGSCGMTGWEAIPHIQKILSAARSAGIPVIHTTGAENEVVAWANGRPRDEDPEMAERSRRKND